MIYVYKKILDCLDDSRRLSDHIERFISLRLSIEDKTLEELLDKLIKTFEGIYRSGDEGNDPSVKFIETPQEKSRRKNQKKTKNKVIFFELEEVKELQSYCHQIVIDKTPQWQVVAQRNGWSPKRKGIKLPNWQIEAENNGWIPPR